MTQPIKVMHLITDLYRGGAESILRDLVAYSDRDRFTHVVVTLFAGDTPLAEEIKGHGVPVIDLGMTAKWRVAGLWRLCRTIRRESPDIIHGWLYHTNVLSRVFGRLCGVPIVISAHHSVSTERAHRDLVYKWTSRLDDRAIAVCESVRRAEIERTGIPDERIVTIYNGIPAIDFPNRETARALLEEELGLSRGVRIVGTVGRLSAAKGYADFARAIEIVLRDHPDSHFVWIGGGEERENLESLTETLGIERSVHMLGDRSDVAGLLAAMDLFVLPSHWEGLSVALLEAMAAGLPAVATAVGGTPEVVVDGETGLLVPPSEPSTLANAVTGLLTDPARAKKMGEAGKLRVAADFAVKRMVGEIETLYQKLLKEKTDTAA